VSSIFRGTALRVMLALLIAVTSISFSTALAEESTGSEVTVGGSPESGTGETPVNEEDNSSDTETDTATSDDENSTLPEGEGEVETDTTTEAINDESETDSITNENEGVGETPALRSAPANIQNTSESEAGTVVITVDSNDRSIASQLPATASWTVSQDGVVLDSDTFAESDLALPATINVNDPVPYGHYDVTVDAGPTFVPYSGTFRVDEAEESFRIDLTPVKTSSVTVVVESSNEDIANSLPATATWTVSQGGEVLDSDTFAESDLALPSSIPVTSKLPYGTYDVVVDAGPTFAPYANSFVVNKATHTFTIELTAIATQSVVTINLSSSDSEVANRMPAGSSWSVSNGTLTLSGEFDQEHLKLPVTIPVESPLPVGEYSVTISAAPTFAAYSHTFTISEAVQTVDISLVPAAHANVTIALTSADVDVDQLPENATWTVTSVANPDFTFTDTFAAEDLVLPRTITVNNPVPYGEYTVTVDASPVFKTYTTTVVLDQEEQTVAIELMPTSLVDQIIQVLIRILNDILNPGNGE